MRKYIVCLVSIAMMLAIPVMAQDHDGSGTGDHIRESGGVSPMFRKNVSKTPEEGSAKAKLNIMPVWVPALQANSGSTDDEGEPVIVPATYEDDEGNEKDGIPYYDYTCLSYDEESSNKCVEWERHLIRVANEAKPLVVVYADEVDGSGHHDVFAAVSRDDGTTWKRKNLSRMADKSSFTLANGAEYSGDCKKPVFQVKGNKIFIAWSSKFAKGGKPTYAIKACLDDEGNVIPDGDCEICTGSDDNEKCESNYTPDDPYYEDDIWGVSGHQGSHDYTEDDFPEVGEIPYSAVWTVRGIIATQDDIDDGVGRFVGDIVWFKPERLTSARRDAYQLFVGGADGAGFALTWQEDPDGIRPGKGVGPGHGWSGATTNHKTDIWYSYITWGNFATVDENFVAGGDPEHDDPELVGRPKALVPMALPVRISDNDVVNTENLKVELDDDGYPIVGDDGNWIPAEDTESSGTGEGSLTGDGSHRYAYEIDGLCDSFYEFTNMQGQDKKICVTSDSRLLDGDTGASRPNVFLQPYGTGPNRSAWAILAYEETKGVGGGPPADTGTNEKPEDGTGSGNEEYKSDEGKIVIYHSFDFQNPDLVSAGDILNLQAVDQSGEPLYLVNEAGEDDDGNVIPGELILDPITGEPIPAYENARRPRFVLQGSSAKGASNTTLLVLYKQGEDGMGRPSDIMLRRNEVTGSGNPYAFHWFVDGAQNVSSVMPAPTEIYPDEDGTWINPERDEDAKGDGVKVVSWIQEEENLNDPSWRNPYDDARAHRGQIRGDFVVIGYSWTPNWAASRNFHDKYNFYIRRSFDGGQTWTTDPASDIDVEHTEIFMAPEEEENVDKHYEVTFPPYAPGEFEPARNVSLLTNNKETVIEPRIVAVPGTIKDRMYACPTGSNPDKMCFEYPEDKQNKNVFYLSYGLQSNDEEGAPTDLYWSFSDDRGQTLKWVTKTINLDSTGNHPGETVTTWDWLAKDKDAEEGEAQLRMTPSGERFYACWLEESEDGSDITLRRIMDPAFEANVSGVVEGYTVDEFDDTALEGVGVLLFQVDENTAELSLYAETVSDEDGYFEFETLPEGDYVVAVDEDVFGLVLVGEETFTEASAPVMVDYKEHPHARVRFMAKSGMGTWLTITKEQDFIDRGDGVYAGDIISYTLTVDNLLGEAISLSVYDPLSPYVTYDGDLEASVLAWENLEISGESSLTLEFDVMVHADVDIGTIIANTATVVVYSDFGGPCSGSAHLALVKDSNTTLVEVVPEPATILLFGVGLLGVFGLVRRRRRNKH